MMPQIIPANSIEVLDAQIYSPISPVITSISPTNIKNGTDITINGRDLFSTKGEATLIFHNKTTNDEFQMKLDRNALSNNGDKITFKFDFTKPVINRSDGSLYNIQSGNYSLRFSGTDTNTPLSAASVDIDTIPVLTSISPAEVDPNSEVNLKIEGTNLYSNSKLSKNPGVLFLMPLTFPQVPRTIMIPDNSLSSDSKSLNFKIKLATLGIPHEKYLVAFLGFSGLSNYFPNASNPAVFTVKNTPLIFNGKSIQTISTDSKTIISPGQTVAAPIPVDFGLPLISQTFFTIAGKSYSIKEIVEQYVTFQIPPDIPKGTQDVIITITGQGSITYKNALDIIVSKLNIKPKAPVSFSGRLLYPEQIIGSDNNGPVKVAQGGEFGIAVNSEINLRNYDVMADGKRCTLLEVVQNYAMYKLAPNIDPAIAKIIIQKAGAGGEVIANLDMALEVLALGIGLTPLTPVTFPNGEMLLTSKFVGNGTVQLNPGDTFGVSFNTRVNPEDVSVFANGVRCSLQSVVDNYMSFKVPPTMDPGVINLVIQYAGGGNITLENALEILASQTTPNKIAFISERDGNSEIYKMDEDGRNQRRLTFNNVYDDAPVISPDGQKIVYISEQLLHIMNIDGSNDRVLSSPEENIGGGSYSWFADSRKLVYSVEGYIYTINSDGTNKTKIFEMDRFSSWGLFVSPDQSRILVHGVYQSENYKMLVLNADGSNYHIFPRNCVWIEQGNWLDNSRIASLQEACNYSRTFNISDINGNIQRTIPKPENLYPNNMKYANGRIGFVGSDWNSGNEKYYFVDMDEYGNDLRKYDLGGIDFIYNKSGSKIFFDSGGSYDPAYSYRVQSNYSKDGIEIYSMTLSDGRISRLTDNGTFDGHGSIYEKNGFTTASNKKFISPKQRFLQKMKEHLRKSKQR